MRGQLKAIIVTNNERNIDGLGWMCTKALGRLGVKTIYMNLEIPPFPIISKIREYLFNETLIEKSLETDPDFVFILKGNMIYPKTLKKIKQSTGAVLCNWNPDNPFNPTVTSRNHREGIRLYDVYFIWGKFLLSELKKIGCNEVVYLPFGYDIELHKKIDVKSKIRDIVFIGTWTRSREKLLSGLTEFDLSIYGVRSNWRHCKDKGVRACYRGKPAFGEMYSRILCESKIALNFIRSQNSSAHNMKTFEIPATGTFMMSTRTTEQKEFFKEGYEAEYFFTLSELKEKIPYYIENDEERERIAHNGYLKVKDKHSYDQRMKEVLSTVTSFKENRMC